MAFLFMVHWHTAVGKQFKQWILYRLDWGPTAGGSWLQQEENQPGWGDKSCAPRIISSEGFLWHFVCTICSSTEQRGHQNLQMKLPPCYLPVPKAFDVWITEGSLQWWASTGGTSQGSEPFSEPSTNDRQTLNCYPAHTLIELLDA